MQIIVTIADLFEKIYYHEHPSGSHNFNSWCYEEFCSIDDSVLKKEIKIDYKIAKELQLLPE